jgi:hypothetical protein
MRNLFLFILLLATYVSEAQKLRKEDKQTIVNLQKHIEFLAGDQLEGRRTGTPGEQKAAEYISGEFQNLGLLPKGTKDYFQPFVINEGKQIDPSTYFTVGGQNLSLNKDFFPLAYSSDSTMEALTSMSIQEMQTPWFLDIKEMAETPAQNPHFDLYQAVKDKAKELSKRGATALFLYNTSATNDDLRFNGNDRSEALSIPVIYFTKEAVKKYFSDPEAMLDIKLKTGFSDKIRTGNNVLGFLDNHAPATVILGAHLDHLGHGEEGNSLQRDNSNQIHNGADDNASGVAALIELARLLKPSVLKQNNYLFIAFSGEEQGLLGSKYFTIHPTIDLSSVNYMINMDMIGRLNDSSHVVTVGGYGTSPSWGPAYSQTGRKALYNSSLTFRFDSSGTGPGDHTSFYLKNIPVLFYFTGIHSDYHKPTDDFTKINYTGELNVVKHIYSLIESQNKPDNKLVFTKTKETLFAALQFSVTLGIMPDYSFNGNGVRVDAISENRPAQKAGLKQGDVIIQLGNYNVQSLENYMQALSRFKRGDKTTVYFSRGSQKLSAAVEF